MDGAAAASSFGVLLQIVFLDLLLSGDNALVIALACRRLPPEQARRAAWLGAGGAILLRLVLTLMTGLLMRLPLVQLLSALPLLLIALNLMEGEEETPQARAGGSGALAAAAIIIVSDATMSIDNVLALGAVSGGGFWLLAFGLALSIPLIVFGSFGFSRLMQTWPVLIDAGSALLGWVAGDMIAGDPLVAGWVRTQAPAVGLALPLACALFVLLQGRMARARAPVQPKREEIAPKPAAPALPAKAPAPPVKAPKTPAPEAVPADADPAGDRWMVLGLVALFAIFGLFIGAVLMLPD